MIKCVELNKEFANKHDMFLALKKNKSHIIELKRAKIYKSMDSGIPIRAYKSLNVANDMLSKGLLAQEGVFYAVINTTNYTDSHNDTHVVGLWTKTLKDNVGKIYYLANHSTKIEDVIAYPEDVKAYTKMINWSKLGYPYSGQTQALIFEIKTEDVVNDVAKRIILEDRPVQNSVTMRYIKIDFAVNSTSPDFVEEKAVWDKYIDSIANKEVTYDTGYTWIVREAAIVKEGSMVLFGSNDTTPVLSESKDEPALTTHELKDIFEPLHTDVLKGEQVKSLFRDLLNK